MIELNEKNTKRAAAKSRKEKPLVRFLAFRHYKVWNKDGVSYYVTFLTRDGKPMAHCDCPAGMAGKAVCYHVTSCLDHAQMVAAANRAMISYSAYNADGRRINVTIPA